MDPCLGAGVSVSESVSMSVSVSVYVSVSESESVSVSVQYCFRLTEEVLKELVNPTPIPRLGTLYG